MDSKRVTDSEWTWIAAYLVAPLLEAADLLAGQARFGLLALDVGERGARALNAALGVLDSLEQGPVLLAPQQLVHLLPHRRAQPRSCGDVSLADSAPTSTTGPAPALPGCGPHANASTEAAAAPRGRGKGTRGEERGPDKRAEERGALHCRQPPNCERACVLAAAACLDGFGLEEDGGGARGWRLVEFDSLHVDPTGQRMMRQEDSKPASKQVNMIVPSPIG